MTDEPSPFEIRLVLSRARAAISSIPREVIDLNSSLQALLSLRGYPHLTHEQRLQLLAAISSIEAILAELSAELIQAENHPKR